MFTRVLGKIMAKQSVIAFENVMYTSTPDHHLFSESTFKVLVTTIDALGHFLNRIITTQWEGMGDGRVSKV